MGDVWVVQMEGWLLKRGAGYKGDAASPQQPSGGFLRRTTLLAKGSGEKKRYFVLATMAGEHDGTPPRAELRYFAAKRGVDAPRKGAVVLDTTMRVDLSGHSTLSLVTLGRTYFLRPDRSTGEPSSALARVTAGKWVHALEFAINGLRAWDLGGGLAGGGASSGAVSRFSAVLSPEELEAKRHALQRQQQSQPSQQTQQQAQTQQQRRPEETAPQTQQSAAAANRSKLLASAEQHGDMWDEFGLQAYNALVAHFGPALMDLQRLEDHLLVRVRMSAMEVALYERQAHLSQDVAVYEQQTSARMMHAVYKDLEDRATLVGRHQKRLEKEALEPIREMHAKLVADLDGIVAFHSGTTGNIERLYKGLYEMRQSITELQVARENAALGRQRTKLTTKASSMVSAASLLRRKSSTVLTQAADEEVQAINLEIESLEELLGQTKAALRKEEAKHAGRMKMALKSLHALEIERLNAQAAALRRAAELEQRVFIHAHRVFQPGAPLSAVVEAVDPVQDVEATSKRLLRALQ